MMGLAQIADERPNWEKTPLLMRLTGMPKWRMFSYVGHVWIYSREKPEQKVGGIDRASPTLWRSGYADHFSQPTAPADVDATEGVKP